MFAYCGNNPVNNVDYSGNAFVSIKQKANLMSANLYGAGGIVVAMAFCATLLSNASTSVPSVDYSFHSNAKETNVVKPGQKP